MSGPTASAQLVVSPFTSASNQFWTFQVTNNSYYLLRNGGTSQLMDDFGNSTNAGTPVGQWVFTGGFNQNWTVSIPVLQLVSVVLTNGGLMPQGVFNGQINPNGLDTTVICQLGTNTSYGLSVTNFIVATNGPVSFSYTIPITTDRSIP